VPEPSDADRRKAAQIAAPFDKARLVDALERGWEITFRCQYCGSSKTWRRDVMLGRARKLLNLTMPQIQAKVSCPRCPGRMPALSFSGLMTPADPDRARWALIETLIDAGLNPTDYGYGWPGRR